MKIWQSTWQSTVTKLQSLSNDEKVTGTQLPPQQTNNLVKLTPEQQIWLQNIDEQLVYPRCNHCTKPLCGGNEACLCAENAGHQEEHKFISAEIKAAESALKAWATASFRPARNGVGYGLVGFSSANFLLSAVAWGATATACLVLAPALVLGICVYWRALREDKIMYQRARADLTELKVDLMLQHLDLIEKRWHRAFTAQGPLPAYLAAKPSGVKPPAELRHPIINSAGHCGGIFVSSSLATVAILKWGAISTLIIDSPITWAAAAIVGAVVGLGIALYFAYKRYANLTAKIAFETRKNELDARLGGIKKLAGNGAALPKQILVSPFSLGPSVPTFTTASPSFTMASPSADQDIPYSSLSDDQGEYFRLM